MHYFLFCLSTFFVYQETKQVEQMIWKSAGSHKWFIFSLTNRVLYKKKTWPLLPRKHALQKYCFKRISFCSEYFSVHFFCQRFFFPVLAWSSCGTGGCPENRSLYFCGFVSCLSWPTCSFFIHQSSLITALNSSVIYGQKPASLQPWSVCKHWITSLHTGGNFLPPLRFTCRLFSMRPS